MGKLEGKVAVIPAATPALVWQQRKSSGNRAHKSLSRAMTSRHSMRLSERSAMSNGFQSLFGKAS